MNIEIKANNTTWECTCTEKQIIDYIYILYAITRYIVVDNIELIRRNKENQEDGQRREYIIIFRAEMWHVKCEMLEILGIVESSSAARHKLPAISMDTVGTVLFWETLRPTQNISKHAMVWVITYQTYYYILSYLHNQHSSLHSSLHRQHAEWKPSEMVENAVRQSGHVQNAIAPMSQTPKR